MHKPAMITDRIVRTLRERGGRATGAGRGAHRRLRACQRSYMNRRAFRTRSCANCRGSRPRCRSCGSCEHGGRSSTRVALGRRHFRACRRSYMNRRVFRTRSCANCRVSRPRCRSCGSCEHGGRIIDARRFRSAPFSRLPALLHKPPRVPDALLRKPSCVPAALPGGVGAAAAAKRQRSEITGQPADSAWARRVGSGSTATGSVTRCISGRSLCESL